MSLAFSAALAAAWMELDIKYSGQYYLLSGWYWILPYGAYLAVALIYLAALLVAMAPRRRAGIALQKYVSP